MSLLQLLLKPGKRNLLDVVTKLPQLGVGSRVTRATWQEYGDSYWEIVAVKPRKDDGTAGKVYGKLTWKGQSQDKVQLITGRAKRVWRWMPDAQELALYQPLAREMQRQNDLQRFAEQRKAAAPESAAAAEGS